MSGRYFRDAIEAMQGYVPGEQPKFSNLIKLNTNENPYPPSPAVAAALRDTDFDRLRRYPDPTADPLRDAIGEVLGFKREEVMAVNGSDDLLTIVFRAFTAPELPVAILEPTYSLYPVLAAMQEAPVMRIRLEAERDFALPPVETVLKQIAEANLLIITRPNAPTGNSFPLAAMREIAENFDGIVLFDEAYADFADDNCLALARELPNVLVSRTMSKSYSLAGLRLGFVVGNAGLIAGLMKLKDSYNVDMLAQIAAAAAMRDQAHLRANTARILRSRERLAGELRALGFRVVESAANFVFAAPPDGDGEGWFKLLRDQAVVARYFPGETTGSFLRVTVGTDAEIDTLLTLTRAEYAGGTRKKR